MQTPPNLARWWHGRGPWRVRLEPPSSVASPPTGPIAWAALLVGGEPTMPLDDTEALATGPWRPPARREMVATSVEAAWAWARTALADAPRGWSVAFFHGPDARVRWRARSVEDVRNVVRAAAGWTDPPPPATVAVAVRSTAGRAPDLTPAQRAVVEHDGGRAVVLAVAGAGKTTTMVARVRHRVATGRCDPASLLVVSFSRAAVAAVRTALGHDALTAAVDVRTFHALAHLLLATRARLPSEALGRRPVERVSGPPSDDVVAAVVERARRQAVVHDPDLADAWRGVDVAAFAAYRGRALARLELPGLATRALPAAARGEARPPPPDPDRPDHPTLLEDFERVRAELGWLDHDQLLIEAWRALHEDAALCTWARQRWRAAVVDEAQDVNAVQLALLEHLLHGRDDVVLVGDDDQSVYGFRGAAPGLLRGFADRHHARVLVLDDAFRTRAEPLAAAVALMAHGRDRVGVRARAARGTGGTLTLDEVDGPEAEARRVVERLEAHGRAGLPWASQVVLLRRFDQAPLLEAAARRGAVPLRLEGAPSFETHPEVVAAWAGVALACGLPGPPAARERAWRRWLAGPAGLARGAAWAAARGLAPVPGAGAEAWRIAAPRGADPTVGIRLAAVAEAATAEDALRLAGADARAWPDDLGPRLRVALAAAHDEGPVSPAVGFDRWRAGRRAPAPSDAVLVTSVHRSKGLEWPVVHVPGLVAGVFPTGDDPEERRLAYVAWTRAREALHLYRDRRRPPSPFLAEGEVRAIVDLSHDLAWRRSGVGADSLAAAWARREADVRFGKAPSGTGPRGNRDPPRGTLGADPRPGPHPRRGQEDALATHRP